MSEFNDYLLDYFEEDEMDDLQRELVEDCFYRQKKIIDKLQSQLKTQTEKAESWKITAESNLKLAAMAGMLSDKNRCLERKIEQLTERVEGLG